MSKRYRYITTTPREICQWVNNSQLIVESNGKSVATRDSMTRLRSLVTLGLPFPQACFSRIFSRRKYEEVSSCLRCWTCFSYFVLHIFRFVAGKGYTYVRGVYGV